MSMFLTFAAALASPAASPQTPLPYPALTNTRREVVNFNVETVRGLTFASDGSMYAINTHGSQLVWHFDLDGRPDLIGQTLLNPVSLALWGNNRILVAGAGAHALALHDRTTFDILNVLRLPSEPADIVVDAEMNAAFVSCQGANVVVKIDLTSFTIADEYPIPAERPRFLYFDPGAAPGVSDNRVIAASFLSGNGSVIGDQLGPFELFPIIDPVAIGFPMFSPPDEDLFSINANLLGAAAVTAVKRRVGTMLGAHGRHPNGAYWALNVNSLNADPLRQSEPALRGDFVRNQAWIGALSTPANFATAAEQVDLDFDPSLGGYSPSAATAFPFGIAFAPAGDNRVYITSPLDDVVSIRSASGAELGRISYPAGSIPLDVELHPASADLLFTYCWGTNEIRLNLVSAPSVGIVFSLGVDPTPAPIRRGRELWYDGHRSQNARTSCNSCHPGGKADFIGWQISDNPTDRKDVMVTQSLLGIEDTFPYHWRGERRLIDFNGAFVDLLGGASVLSDAEFEDFQAFVFSLQPHANPRASLDRMLPDAREVVSEGPLPSDTQWGNPALGVAPYTTVLGFNRQTCAECHTLETGSNGDFIVEVGTDAATANMLETPHLRELRHKDQPVTSLGGTFLRARSGFGIAHNGRANNLFGFVSNSVFNLTPSEIGDVTAFVRRFDNGIAPAAHAAFMLDSAHPANAAEISALLGQANVTRRWIDVVAFGRFVDPASGVSRIGRWFFNPATGLFDCNDTNVTSQPLGTFTAQALAGQTAMAFLGIPPGNGFRFALDPDHDGLVDSKELIQGTSVWNPDTDGDSQPDGYEVTLGSDPMNPTSLGVDTSTPTGTVTFDFTSASLAKVEVLASEDVTVTANFQRLGGVPHVSASPVFGRLTTLALQGLEPSTPVTAPLGASPSVFNGFLTLTDRSGNQGFITLTPFTAGDMLHPVGVAAAGSPLIVSALSATQSSAGSVMTLTGSIGLSQRFADPGGVNAAAVNRRVAVLQVLRETGVGTNLYAIDSLFTPTVGATAASLQVVDAAGTTRTLSSNVNPGPFLITPTTGAAGTAAFALSVPSLSTGQKVRVRVTAILEPDLTVPGAFVDSSLFLYAFPPTQVDNRGLEFTH